jgi:hypothetical protein
VKVGCISGNQLPQTNHLPAPVDNKGIWQVVYWGYMVSFHTLALVGISSSSSVQDGNK